MARIAGVYTESSTKSRGEYMKVDRSRKMTGALLPGDSTVEMRNFDIPVPGHGEVLIRTKSSTICGSDIRAIYHTHHGKGPEAPGGCAEKRCQNVLPPPLATEPRLPLSLCQDVEVLDHQHHDRYKCRNHHGMSRDGNQSTHQGSPSPEPLVM